MCKKTVGHHRGSDGLAIKGIHRLNGFRDLGQDPSGRVLSQRFVGLNGNPFPHNPKHRLSAVALGLRAGRLVVWNSQPLTPKRVNTKGDHCLGSSALSRLPRSRRNGFRRVTHRLHGAVGGILQVGDRVQLFEHTATGSQKAVRRRLFRKSYDG